MRPRWIVLLLLGLTLVASSPLSARARDIVEPDDAPTGLAIRLVLEDDTAPLAHDEGIVAGLIAPEDVRGAALITVSDTITATNISQFLSNPAPPEAGSIYGRICGNVAFVRRIWEALDWLQAYDSDAYQRVDTYITTITPSPYTRLAQARPMPDGSCLVRALARRPMSVEMIAALLYHEASHCYQFATVGVLTSQEAEVFAYTEQIAFMERNGFSDEEIEFYRRVLDYYAGQPDDGRNIPPPNF